MSGITQSAIILLTVVLFGILIYMIGIYTPKKSLKKMIFKIDEELENGNKVFLYIYDNYNMLIPNNKDTEFTMIGNTKYIKYTLTKENNWKIKEHLLTNEKETFDLNDLFTEKMKIKFEKGE